MDILEKLKDLHKQATTERSHYYVEATCKAAIAEIERLRAALQFIADGYDNHDVNHVDYRVKVYQVATEALEAVEA